LAGIIKLFPPPAGDGNVANLFFTVYGSVLYLAGIADEYLGLVGEAGTLVALEGRPELLGREGTVPPPHPRLVPVGQDRHSQAVRARVVHLLTS
jgi:hypothetical protein